MSAQTSAAYFFASLLRQHSHEIQNRVTPRFLPFGELLRTGHRPGRPESQVSFKTIRNHQHLKSDMQILNWNMGFYGLPLAYMSFGILGSLCAEFMYSREGRQRNGPIHSSLLVFVAEFIKLAIAVFCLFRNQQKVTLKDSHLFITHGLLYFINNALYFWVLGISPTATVQILLQLRIPFTACLHHFWIHNQPHIRPWISLLALFVGVVVTQLNDKLEFGSYLTILVCILVSWNSAVATNFNEKLLKSLEKPFWEQQLYVYLYGCLFSGLNVFSVRSQTVLYNFNSTQSQMFFAWMTIFFASFGGLLNGFILKSMDNIVKLISSVLATVIFGLISCAIGIVPPYATFFLGSMIVFGSAYSYGKSVQQIQGSSSSKDSQVAYTQLLSDMDTKRRTGFDWSTSWPLIYSSLLGIFLLGVPLFSSFGEDV